MLLTVDELAELTGYKQAARQIRWLAANRWPFVVGADGCPKVGRAYADALLGAPVAARRVGPRLGGLNGKAANKVARLAA